MALAHASSGTVRDVDPSSVGMMEGAFFVSRTELLDWVNTTFNLSLTKIEQGASGAIYLQIVDGLFGGGSKVPMAKVKWNCKFDYEYIQNYKLLQSVFNKQGIKKHIEVDKLIKGKYQDNLEFLQWLKAFYDRQAAQFRAPDKPYNAYERRKLAGSTFPDWAQPHDPATSSVSVSRETPSQASVSAQASTSPVTSRATGYGSQQGEKRRMTSASRLSSMQSSVKGRGSPYGEGEAEARSVGSSRQVSGNRDDRNCLRELEATTLRLRERVKTLEADVDQARLERDFYFQKLRRLEVMCGPSGAGTLSVKDVLAVLYATDEHLEEGEDEAMDVQGEEEKEENRRYKAGTMEDPSGFSRDENVRRTDKTGGACATHAQGSRLGGLGEECERDLLAGKRRAPVCARPGVETAEPMLQ
ncbi:calponin homology (ch) domain-containing protein [Toxoplasma gondii RUB]|uniref:Microtubule-associated protein RP/EB family member 3, putative n=11 Tax=Toxoplasma gondii TaxID=5811 RepID=B9PMZ7_TOXGV|nr:putative microtubule-associated protein RP/EB family [Toxoplasma gondii GT1]ESS32762.1 putative microtubule-associated protein RP/EB family [Toxoplasma gondii VEG]KAF4640781.1 putative microtubule-associated protein RP/EB family [Toxoplasma gondii]KFG42331.1 calponin homology (ch) domain-containing protein [Toxoplasma gondii p89]KFG45141.1 calponin homology (ch) domain-containing protein [Toxoplasma gondii GAB2-2007-GAL-DOM2]KFG52009.1 calponin homology (ch) domain-containing protein [Toxop